MKKDNRGFTLIELVICMVIFSIVVASVFGFMLAGARSYSTITNRLNLELDSQLAMNQLENYIMDCNTNLYYSANPTTSTNTLFVINKGSTDTKYDVHIFQFTGGRINYGFGEDAATLSSGNYTYSTTAVTDQLADSVTAFSVRYFRADGTEITTGSRAASVTITVELTRNSVPFRGTKTIALRNKPTISIVQQS